MADTVEKKIYQALLVRMQTFTPPAGVTIVYPGVAFNPTATSRFVSVEVHFNRPIETDLSLEMDPIRQGFIRGNVFYPKNYALVDAFDVAGNIRAHFKRGTKLFRDGIQVRFDEDPALANVMTTDTHLQVPVTAFWRSYPQVSA